MARKPSKLIERLEVKYHRKARWWRFQETAGNVVTYAFFISLIVFGLLLLSDLPSSITIERDIEIVRAAAPAPTPTPVPTPTAKPDDLFVKLFGNEAHIARAICKAENGFADPTAQYQNSDRWTLENKARRPWLDQFPKGSEDHGLCQINLYYHWDKIPAETKEDKAKWLHNPENNLKIMKQIRTEWKGWDAWTTFKSGKYLNYL